VKKRQTSRKTAAWLRKEVRWRTGVTSNGKREARGGAPPGGRMDGIAGPKIMITSQRKMPETDAQTLCHKNDRRTG